ncbi:doublecortin domain-containing protein 2C [Erethizon dorsatum]
MGTRGPRTLVDTTQAKTILVYRNGDQFYVGRKFVLSRRRVVTFEALLDLLTEQVAVPFGVRRLYTPVRGHQVLELDALQAGGKYVAAGRERFKKLDYIHIVPRKPAKMRKLKEIKPVVHCDINVPSRWQTCHRISRHINVFTNGKLFSPPIKIIIPKFSLSDWNSVLATIGEKVFPLGGVRKLFTMNGHLLDNSKDLQDNHFYVAAGLETFKHFPYWRSPRVPSEVRQRYADLEKCPQRKKKVEFKEPPKYDDIPPETKDSVYYAKEGNKKTLVEPFILSGAEGDVYKAQTPTRDAQGALDVKEDADVKVELPVDQVPAEMVKEVDDACDNTPNFEVIKGTQLAAKDTGPRVGRRPQMRMPGLCPWSLCLGGESGRWSMVVAAGTAPSDSIDIPCWVQVCVDARSSRAVSELGDTGGPHAVLFCLGSVLIPTPQGSLQTPPSSASSRSSHARDFPRGSPSAFCVDFRRHPATLAFASVTAQPAIARQIDGGFWRKDASIDARFGGKTLCLFPALSSGTPFAFPGMEE